MFKGYHNSINSPLYRGFPNLTFGGNTGTAYSFSRCLLWLDAAYGTNTITNGANISFWSDRINGVLYTQVTAANQPTYVLSDANFNNFPTINFGTNLSRFLSSTTTFSIGSYTLGIIVRSTSVSELGNNIIGQNADIGFFGGGTNSNVTGYGFYNANSAYTKSNIEDTSMHIIVANRDCIIVDGVNQTSSTSPVTLNFTHIGSNDGNYQACCVISEILLFDYVMSSTDAITLSNNINVKYQKY